MIDKDRTKTKRNIENSKELSELLNISSRRFILFDNKIDKQDQVEDLLKIVRKLAEDNDESCFNNAIFGHELSIKLATIDNEITLNEIKYLQDDIF